MLLWSGGGAGGTLMWYYCGEVVALLWYVQACVGAELQWCCERGSWMLTLPQGSCLEATTPFWGQSEENTSNIEIFFFCKAIVI